MKTDALVSMLARGAEVDDPRRLFRDLATAATVGLVIAAASMLVFLGPRPDFDCAVRLPMFWLKLLLPTALAVSAFSAATRLARPGDRATAAWLAIAVMIGLLWATAATSLAQAPAGQRQPLVAGSSALPCIVSIVLLSLPLLIATFIAMRGHAPTRARSAGAAAGALAGAAAAAVYALHCTETAVSFMAVWYVIGMAIPACLGALLGPRLLRWA